jgi:hypothetical protein
MIEDEETSVLGRGGTDPAPTEASGFFLLDFGGGQCFTESLELRLPVRDALDRE